MSLEDSLARVPGLAGYLGQTQFNNQRDLSGLQQMGLLEGILTKHRTAQEEQQIKGILSQSTDLQSAIPALMKVGPLGITTAQHLATLGKAQQEQKLTAQLMGGGSMEKMTPEQFDLLGQKLALGGHPGASTVMSIADKRRTEAQKRTEDTQTLGSLQGAPTTITPERATAPVGMENMPDAQKIAALQSMGQGAKSISFLPPGEPTQLAPTVTRRDGGAFAPFFDSPIPAIASAARDYQARVDSGKMTGRDAEKRLETLQKAQTSFEAGQQRQPLVQIVNADGKTVYAPRSDAVGAEPPAKPRAPDAIPPEHSTLTGAEYLATLPIGKQNVIKAVAEGRVPLTSFSTRNNERDAVIQMVQQYDPTFEAGKAPARMAVQKAFTSGVESRNVTALNTAISHMGTLSTLGDKLQNNDIKGANAVLNAVLTQFGKPQINNYDIAKTAVGDELMRVFRQVGASQQEADAWKEKFTSSNSPSAIQGAIRTGAELLKGRIDALNDTWDRGMGTEGGYPKLLSDRSKAAMAKFGVNVGGAAPTTYSDADKERRYQEWKAQQKP